MVKDSVSGDSLRRALVRHGDIIRVDFREIVFLPKHDFLRFLWNCFLDLWIFFEICKINIEIFRQEILMHIMFSLCQRVVLCVVAALDELRALPA